VPILSASANDASWLLEAGAIPARAGSLTTVELTPAKLGAITVFTAETLRTSVPNLESLMRLSLSEAVAAKLDATMFGTSAADSGTGTPGGMRYNINAKTASVLDDRTSAMLADVETLASSVAAVSGSNPIFLIASPAQAIALKTLSRPLPFEILSSAALTAGVVIAVAGNAVCSAFDPTPRFATSNQGVLHMDTAPTQISGNVTATPVAMAFPLKSLWQIDAIALRIILEINFVVRSPTGVAWLTASW